MKTFGKLIFPVMVVLCLASVPVLAQKTEVMQASKKAVNALKRKDMKTLSTLVHPVKGLRFSPYFFVDKKTDRVFKKSAVAGLRGKKVYYWGEYDAGEESIRMTFGNYWKRFIYDRDFARAPRVSYQEQIGSGTLTFNIDKAYPNGKFVEYHFPSSDEMLDWRSLFLTFEKYRGKWYLVNIAHGEWTT